MDAAEYIRSSLSMDAVARQYGFTPNRGGYIACPFHGEHTPSLKVYSQPGRGWHCYGCGAGGTAIDFVMQLFRIDFRAALVRLNADFGLGLNNTKPDPEALRALRRAQREASQKKQAHEAAYDDKVRRRRELFLKDCRTPGEDGQLRALDWYLDTHQFSQDRGDQK